MLSLHASNKLEDGCRRPGPPSQLRSPSLLETQPFAAPRALRAGQSSGPLQRGQGRHTGA